jgi:hypothetical protein
MAEKKTLGSGARIVAAALLILWIAMVAVTLRAVAELGLGDLIPTFIGDFAHPWRAQFYSDFSVQLFLVAGWIVYRTKASAGGLLAALLALALGALFILPYILAAFVAAGGNGRQLLLGRRFAEGRAD